MTTFPVRVKMLSDWHLGTGTGRRGLVNQVVARDGRALPYMRGDAFTRLWRDGCEVAAHGLDEGRDGPWHDWVDYLFGSQSALSGIRPLSSTATPPREAVVTSTPLRLPDAVADALIPRPQLVAATTLVRDHVRVEAATGAAAHGSKWLVELARAGLTLTGTVTVAGLAHLDTEQSRTVTALLAIGLTLIDGLGGSRRRGAGRCRVTVEGLEADLDWLETASNIPSPPSPANADQSPYPITPYAPGEGEWECVRLMLRLRQPVIVADRVVGNTVRSRTSIPGTLLLRAVLARLSSAAAHAAARAGDLLVTDATLAVGGEPGRVPPAVLVCDKTERERWCNVLVEPMPDGRRPEPIEGYLGPFDGHARPTLLQPALVEQTHNAIADDVQRPTEAVGGIYTYQAIAEGTEMLAELRWRPGVLPSGWRDLLPTTMRLGRSRRADYGEVEVTAEPAGPPGPASTSGHGGIICVWLLSDLLVHDARLRPSTNSVDVARTLAGELGVALTPIKMHAKHLSRRTESWHRVWHLPRPTLLGLPAGTCLVFAVDGDLDPAAVARVHCRGVGLRRAEGFGQIRINDPITMTAMLDRVPAAAADSSSPDPVPADARLTGDDAEQVRLVERAAWINAIDDRVEQLAATDAGRTRALGAGYAAIGSTQLAGLRLASVSPMLAHRWLTALDGTVQRTRTWESVRDHLRRLLEDRDAIWAVLGLDESALCVCPDSASDLRALLASHARRRLVARCLAVHRREEQVCTNRAGGR